MYTRIPRLVSWMDNETINISKHVVFLDLLCCIQIMFHSCITTVMLLKYSILYLSEQHRWCNGQKTRLVYGRSWIVSSSTGRVQSKTIKLVLVVVVFLFFLISTHNYGVRTDRLARNRDEVPVCLPVECCVYELAL